MGNFLEALKNFFDGVATVLPSMAMLAICVGVVFLLYTLHVVLHFVGKPGKTSASLKRINLIISKISKIDGYNIDQVSKSIEGIGGEIQEGYKAYNHECTGVPSQYIKYEKVVGRTYDVGVRSIIIDISCVLIFAFYILMAFSYFNVGEFSAASEVVLYCVIGIFAAIVFKSIALIFCVRLKKLFARRFEDFISMLDRKIEPIKSLQSRMYLLGDGAQNEKAETYVYTAPHSKLATRLGFGGAKKKSINQKYVETKNTIGGDVVVDTAVGNDDELNNNPYIISINNEMNEESEQIASNFEENNREIEVVFNDVEELHEVENSEALEPEIYNVENNDGYQETTFDENVEMIDGNVPNEDKSVETSESGVIDVDENIDANFSIDTEIVNSENDNESIADSVYVEEENYILSEDKFVSENDDETMRHDEYNNELKIDMDGYNSEDALIDEVEKQITENMLKNHKQGDLSVNNSDDEKYNIDKPIISEEKVPTNDKFVEQDYSLNNENGVEISEKDAKNIADDMMGILGKVDFEIEKQVKKDDVFSKVVKSNTDMDSLMKKSKEGKLTNEDLITHATVLKNSGDESEESLRTMQQVALLLQKEREKKNNKTTDEQKERMNKALKDLLRVISKKS